MDHQTQSALYKELAGLAGSVARLRTAMRDANQSDNPSFMSSVKNIEAVMRSKNSKVLGEDYLNSARLDIKNQLRIVDKHIEHSNIQKGYIDNSVSSEYRPLLLDMLRLIERIIYSRASAIPSSPDIPNQRPAPIKVRVEGDRLTIHNPEQVGAPLDGDTITNLRRSAYGTMKMVVEHLKSRNVDKASVAALKPFLNCLNEDPATFSVEELGVNWQISSDIFALYRDELSETIVIQYERVLKTTNVVLCQFEQWRLYLSQAEALAQQNLDGRGAALATEAFAKGVAALDDEGVVDDEIVGRLTFLSQIVQHELIRYETAVPPLILATGNILAGISHYALKTAMEIGPNVVHKPILLPLFILAVGLMKRYATPLSKYKSFVFFKDTFDYIQQKFPWLKDVLPS